MNAKLSSSTAKLLNYWVVIYLAWSGILFSTSPIFVLRTAVVTKLPSILNFFCSTSLTLIFKTIVVTKRLVSGIFLSTSPISFCKFCLPVLYWFMWIKVVASEFSFLDYLVSKLITFVFSVLNFVFNNFII